MNKKLVFRMKMRSYEQTFGLLLMAYIQDIITINREWS